MTDINQLIANNLADNNDRAITEEKLREVLLAMNSQFTGSLARLGNRAVFSSDPAISGKEQPAETVALKLIPRADSGFTLTDAKQGELSTGILIPNSGRYFVYFSVRVKNSASGAQSSLSILKKPGSSPATAWDEYQVIPYSGATGIPEKDYFTKFFTVAEINLDKNDIIFPYIASQIPYTIEDYFMGEVPIISGMEFIIQELH